MLAPHATMKRACDDRLGVDADRLPHRGLVAGGPGRGADRPVEQARAEGVEEAAVHAPVGEQPHVAGVRVGEDRLRTEAGADRAEAFRDRVESLVPGDALEPPLSLAPDALHRVEEAIGAVDALEVVVHLGAEKALREPVIGIPSEVHGSVALHRHGHHARVGTIVGADDLVDLRHDWIGIGRPSGPTATSTTSASVTFTRSPRPAPQRSASTLTLTVIDVRPDPDRLGEEVHDVAQEDGLVELHLAHRLGDVAVGRRSSGPRPPRRGRCETGSRRRRSSRGRWCPWEGAGP